MRIDRINIMYEGNVDSLTDDDYINPHTRETFHEMAKLYCARRNEFYNGGLAIGWDYFKERKQGKRGLLARIKLAWAILRGKDCEQHD